jgi:hypothetical protein
MWKPRRLTTLRLSLGRYRDRRTLYPLLVVGFPERWPGEGHVVHVGFMVDKAALEQVFSEYFRLPCQTFNRLLHTRHHPSSSGAREW